MTPARQKIKVFQISFPCGVPATHRTGVFTLMESSCTASWSLDPREVGTTVMLLRLQDLLISADFLFGEQKQR